MKKELREQKLQFIQAVNTGNMRSARELAQSIKLNLTGEIPLFMNYTKKGGRYYIDWKNLILTESQFKALNKQCPIWWNTISHE